MLLAGSDKITRSEILSTLRFNHTESFDAAIKCAGDDMKSVLKSEKDTNILQANGMFLQSGFMLQDAFVETLKKHFTACMTGVDFKNSPEEARQTINDWILNNTNKIIHNLIPEKVINSDTRLVLASAVHFKGIWKEKFVSEQTVKGKFSLLNGEELNAPMMQSKRTVLMAYFDEELDCRAVRIPFQCHEMLILLPNAKNGIHQVLLKLLETSQKELFKKVFSADAYFMHKIMLRLPRFQLAESESKDFKEIISAMGMPSTFSSASADFSGITGHRDLCVANVFHKATIVVRKFLPSSST
ncbi:unnamed protein product [Dibothriocephalus latus]|uniref:Serpin domain-containing protein n=1 Tax=Dibothriocephalus latus TaxID=60516 RepID=A0A3P7PYN4_DIBLA|nr:unnamed protein product [Dibothriocephalus latus]